MVYWNFEKYEGYEYVDFFFFIFSFPRNPTRFFKIVHKLCRAVGSTPFPPLLLREQVRGAVCLKKILAGTNKHYVLT
jgi:hypothetical protein